MTLPVKSYPSQHGETIHLVGFPVVVGAQESNLINFGGQFIAFRIVFPVW